MNADYADIRSLIADPPSWFDEHAVPRYCDFAPCLLADIYAEEAALALIRCQDCHTEFRVAFSFSAMDKIRCPDAPTLAAQIRNRELHFGDPPNVRCCLAGPTMNSEPHRVLEYWRRRNLKWERNRAFEIDIKPIWVDWKPE